MANSAGFIAHVLELLGGAGPADARRMFSGHGLYVDGVMVGLAIDDTLYLKSDDATRGAFTDRGLAPFQYASKRKGTVSTSYYQPPEDALESAAAMRPWLELALGAARRAAGKRRTPVTRAARR